MTSTKYRTLKTLLQKGRPFMLRRITGHLGTGTHLPGLRVYLGAIAKAL
jgi:hypothetical protein